MICLFNSTASKSDLIQTNGDYILDMLCTSAIITEELNGEYSFDGVFRISDTFPKALYDMLTEESILKVSEEYGEEYFRIAKVIKSPRNITVFARHITISDILTLWCEDVRPENQNGAGAISWIYNNSIGNKLLTVNSDITETNTSYFINKNVYECLFTADNSFLDRWGGEVYRRGLNLSINKRVGADRGVTIRSKKNLTGFEATTSVDTLITRIYPKGYDGITINEKYIDSKYINNYARIYSKEVKFDDIKVNGESIDDGFETLVEAQEELKRRVKQMYEVDRVDLLTASYRINFVELGKTEEYKNYSILEKTWLGDTVEVIEDTLGINISVRVLKRKFDVLKNKRTETELSNKDIKTKPPTIQQIANEIEKIPTTDTFLQMAKDQATSVINAGINGYVVANKNEILIMDTSDKNTATKVWRFNVNGIGYSNTGYYGEYGTAITMEGQIVADFITTGVLNANLIKTGIIKSLNGESFINLDTGEARLTGTVKSYSGNQYVSLGSGGVTFQDWRRKEQMLRMGIAFFDSNRDMNGVTFAMPKYSDFLRFAHIDKEDLTNGWSSTDTQYNFMDFWSSEQNVGGITYKKGVNVYAPLYVNNGLLFNNKSGFTSDIKPNITWNTMTELLGICGDNGLFLGYKTGEDYNARIVLTEASHPGTGDQIKSWGNWNFSGFTLHNLTIANYNLANTYANLLTNTMAEVSPLETDYKDNIRYIYKNISTVNNKIILNIPNEYVGREYTIVGIVKKGFGDYAITSEEETRFIIETDREMTLNIEVSIV